MTSVTPFSLPKTLSTPLPRQRVFYIGYRYETNVLSGYPKPISKTQRGCR